MTNDVRTQYRMRVRTTGDWAACKEGDPEPSWHGGNPLYTGRTQLWTTDEVSGPEWRELTVIDPATERIGHLIEFREDGYTVQHPLSCRPNLFACPLNQAAIEVLHGPPALGVYPVKLNDGVGMVIDFAHPVDPDTTQAIS